MFSCLARVYLVIQSPEFLVEFGDKNAHQRNEDCICR
jgi:hypothetical protein